MFKNKQGKMLIEKKKHKKNKTTEQTGLILFGANTE